MYSGDEEFGDDVTSGIEHQLSGWDLIDLAEREDGCLVSVGGLIGDIEQLAKRKTRSHPERELEKACSDLLQLDGWRLLKTDPVSDRRRGKGFGEIGMADCLYLRYHVYNRGLNVDDTARSAVQLVWIEWKAPGGQATAAQRFWISAERARGALVWLAGVDFAPSVDDFLTHYRASGLMRRKL